MAIALVLPFLLVAALGVALVGWLLTRTRAPLTVPQHAAVMQVHRRSTRWFAWGVALALVVTVALFALAGVSLGRVAALAPAVGGMTLLLVMCVGELRSPRQTTLTRTAVARPRRVRDLVGAGPHALAARHCPVCQQRLPGVHARHQLHGGRARPLGRGIRELWRGGAEAE